MKKLYLDDIRIPKTKGWNIVRSYDAFVEWIDKNGLPDKVSFDHDLAEIDYNPLTGTQKFEYYEKTGLDAAKWLGQYCLEKDVPFPKWNVHSANPIGKANIEAYINNVIKHQNKL